MRSFIIKIVFCLSIVLPAFAQSDADKNAEFQDLLRSGEFQAAEEFINENYKNPLDRLFLQARVYLTQGDFKRAIPLLREVIKAEPNAILPREDLANALFQSNQLAAAEREFRALLRINKNPQARAAYGRAITNISGRKPLGIFGSFAILPSSASNRYSITGFGENLGFELNDETSTTTGFGVYLGLNGFARASTGTKSQLRLDWSVAARDYKNKQFDSYTAFVGVKYIRDFSKTRVSVGTYSRWNWTHAEYGSAPNFQYAYGLDRRDIGYGLDIKHVFNQKNSLDVGLVYEHQDRRHRDPTRVASANQALDGDFRSINVSWGHVLRPDLRFDIGLGASDLDTFLKHNGYDGRNASARISKQWKSGLAMSFGVSAGKRGYNDFFPAGFGLVRSDKIRGLEISASHSKVQYRGIIPRLSCRFDRTESNVDLYDSQSTGCSISVFRKF